MGVGSGIAILIAAAAFQSSPITQEPSQLVARLGGPAGEFAAGQLALLGSKGEAFLAKATFSGSALVRMDAAFGLGMADDPAALEPLLKLVVDPDPEVVAAAVRGISTSSFVDRPQAILVARKGHKDEALRAFALLNHFPRWEESFVAVASDPRSPVRAEALGGLMSSSSGFDAGLAALADPRPETREQAAALLVAQARTPERESLVRHLAATGSVPLREAFADASQHALNGGPRWLAELMAQDSIPESRREAAGWFSNHFRWERRPEDLAELARLADDPDSKVGSAVASGLAEWGGDNGQRPDPFDPLKLIGPALTTRVYHGLSKFLSTPRAFQAAIALAFMESDRGWDVLASTLHSANYSDRLAAIMAFGNLRESRALPLLLPLLDDGNVIEFTLRSIGKIGDPSVVPLLLSRMEKRPETWESPWIASAIKATGDLEARKEMLRFTKDQSDPFRRAAYLEALGILGGDEIREYLMEEIKSPEPAVAYSAAYGLSQLKDPVTDAILQNLIAGSDAGLAKAAQDAVWRRRDERSR